MRGEDQQQNHIFSYLSPEERVRKDHPLRAIRIMVCETALTSKTLRLLRTCKASYQIPVFGPMENN
jgi:hypothetical protein